MSPNELADLLEFDAPIEGINKEAAAMLRQQQAHIELLEAKRMVAYSIGYEDATEQCAERAEAYAYMSPNFTALAEEFRVILRKAE